MRAAWFVARAQLRHRWGSVVVLTLIVGITGAVVLASVAGARRTSSSIARFRDETSAANLTVFVPKVDPAVIKQLGALPGVQTIGVARQLMSTVNGGLTSGIGAPVDDNIGVTVDRARLLDGRRPDQHRVHEVAVPEGLAKANGLRVGDSITMHGYTPDQVTAVIESGSFDVGDPEGPEVELRVVGITRSPADLSFEGDEGGVMFTTRAFGEKYAGQIGSFAAQVLRVRTVDSDAARNFVRVARAQTAKAGAEGEFQVQPTSETEGAVRESIDVVANGLVVFSVVAAFAGFVVVGLIIRRFVDGGADVLPALRGLGVSTGGRALALALAAAPAAVGGAFLAVVGAWLASPLFPLGLARRAEPHLGLDADALVLGLGFVAGVVLVGLLMLGSAYRVARASLSPPGSARVAAPRPSPGTGLPPAISIGVAAALAPRRARRHAAVWPAMAGTFVAALGIVAVGVVASSMRHLERTPSVYGYNWDAHVVVSDADRRDGTTECNPTRAMVVKDVAVAAATDTCRDSIEIDGYSVAGTGYMHLKGDLGPNVLEGRAPRSKHEVALGTKTIDRVHAGIGDIVSVAGPGAPEPARFRIVGRVALPYLAPLPGESSDVQVIDDGATFTGRGLGRVASAEGTGGALVLISWRDGVDVAAASDRIKRLPGGGHRPQGAAVPLEVDRIEQLRVLPWMLGGFLALIGIVGLGYGLVTSVRRRARDLAILKTIGFRRRQVMSSVGIQATIYGVLGLVVGIPLGIVVGRAAWSRIAGRAGMDVVPVLPLWFVAAVAVGALLVANAVAWFPARRAARLQPAVVLRSE